MEKMTEKQLTLKILRGLTQSIEALSQYMSQQDAFLRDNFRHYNSYGPSVYGWLQTVREDIDQVERMTLSNADNAHRLSPTEEEEEQSGITYVQGDYPQNHSIQQAQQRVTGYQQQTQPTPWVPWGSVDF